MQRIAHSDHLVALVAQAEAAGARLAAGDADRRAQVAAAARRESARLSARLDGSPLTDETADAVDAREARQGGEARAAAREGWPPSRAGGWAAALRLDGMATQEVAAVEYANLLACADAEAGLAETLFERPLETLSAVHGLVCQGLVAPEVVGRPRRTEQAVHDGAQGRMLYRAADPAALPGLLDELAAWLGSGSSAAMPTLVVAGAVHERLLQWQPFEAGNGRVARTAARLVLRARGLDPHAAAVVERGLAADPLGYYGEVAATIRRRGELVPFLERYAEAAADALDAAADAAAPRPRPALPPRGLAVCGALPEGATVTLAEYAGRTAVGPQVARRELAALTAAGLLAREPRTRGLRYRRISKVR